MHGGASPAVRAGAARRKAEAQATALLEVIWDPEAAPVTNPIDALQSLAGRLQHAANVLGARMESADLDGPTGLAWSRVLREFRLALDGMARLNLEERVVNLANDRAAMVVTAFTNAVDALGLLPGERSLVIEQFLGGLDYEGETPEVLAASQEVTSKWAGSAYASVMRAVLDQLELSADQWVVARRVVPEQFRRMGAEQQPVVRGELEGPA